MVRKLFAEGSYEELPHDGMRKTIAARLSESNATVPSYNISVDCQLDALLKLRGELNKAAPEKDGKPAYKLSVNDFIIKALALALRDVPMANGHGPLPRGCCTSIPTLAWLWPFLMA
jgi:pyruvate dehydrogenase E2 component (dihydrolipoamide acetyltransferase)